MKINKLLIIGLTWPEPNSTGAGVRMMQLIDVFIDANYDVTFASAATQTQFSADLKEIGIKIQSIVLNDTSFDTFIHTLSPDIVLFDRFLTEEQFGWRVTETCPNAIRVLDTEDLHSLRHVREHCFKKDLPFCTKTWLQDDKTKREIASIYRSDLSLIISSYEMQLLMELVRIDKRFLLHLPFMVNEIDDLTTWPKFEQRKNFVFIGGGKHKPNLDAINYLKSDIWPKIYEKLPTTKMNIYGAYLPQQILEMNNPKQGFLVKGRAEEVKTVTENARICIAPIRFGAGIKGKLLHAMQFGTPSITTSIGAEGMYDNLPWNGAIEDETEKIVRAAVSLYTSKEAWISAQNNGKILINKYYAKSKLTERLLKSIESIFTHKEKHRSKNFIGNLLQHHTLLATKYMGKWIEEKNKTN
ncbi:glycosyltransferase [Maribacter sp. CXY002]|uniref:glycosyltransferase n=1 Tax=Maribacter luteocoastalis TaxID=3407671 RepID=UPI003B67D24D